MKIKKFDELNESKKDSLEAERRKFADKFADGIRGKYRNSAVSAEATVARIADDLRRELYITLLSEGWEKVKK